MDNEHHDTVERTLWASIVALEEAADIAETLATELGPTALKEAQRKRAQADAIRAMLNDTPDQIT